ncbi:MAG: response regulator [Myxococcales bacterium]|nr:response regulator [Myxococcales bacterium]
MSRGVEAIERRGASWYRPLEVARETIRRQAERARGSGRSLLTRVIDEPPPEVRGEPEGLRQALVGLVGEALRSTEREAIELELRWLPTGVGQGRLELRVRGTELGIVLPLSVHQPESEPELSAGEVAAALSPGRHRVLLVEDSRLNQLVVRAMLDRLGIEMVAASDGEHALSLLDGERFDLVLMDVQMPVMDGHETTRRLRALEQATGRPRTPVMALTGNARPEDREACVASGMDDLVAKPFEVAVLHEVLVRWLAA